MFYGSLMSCCDHFLHVHLAFSLYAYVSYMSHTPHRILFVRTQDILDEEPTLLHMITSHYNKLYLQQLYFQIRSHPKQLGVTTSTYELGGGGSIELFKRKLPVVYFLCFPLPVEQRDRCHRKRQRKKMRKLRLQITTQSSLDYPLTNWEQEVQFHLI